MKATFGSAVVVDPSVIVVVGCAVVKDILSAVVLGCGGAAYPSLTVVKP